MLGFVAAVCLAPSGFFSFSGGSDYDLCKEIARSVSEPVVMLAEPRKQWKAFAFGFTGERDFESLLMEKGQIYHFREKSWGLAPHTYPIGLYFTTQTSFYTQAFRTATVFAKTTDGKQTVLTVNGPATLSQLFAYTKKPVRWHWFFDNFRLSAYCIDVKDDEIVRAVADSIGAKVVERSDSFYLDFNPVVYRQRAIATLDILPEGVYRTLRSDIAITRSCLAWMTDDEISSLFQEPGKMAFSNPPAMSLGTWQRPPALTDVTMEIGRPMYPTNAIGSTRRYIRSVSLIQGSVICTTTGLFYRNTAHRSSISDWCFDATKAVFAK